MTSYLARSKVILSFRNPRARSSRRNTYISVHPPISRTSDPILELLLEGKSYSNLHRDFHWISIDFSQKSRNFLLRRSSEEFLGSKKCRILCGIHFWQLETLSARPGGCNLENSVFFTFSRFGANFVKSKSSTSLGTIVDRPQAVPQDPARVNWCRCHRKA